MRGVRRSLTPFSVFLVCFACSGGRETGSPDGGGQTVDTAASASQDSAAPVSGTAADPTSVRVTPPASRDTVPDTSRLRATTPAKPTPKPAAAKPAAPKPAPAPAPTMDRPDTSAARTETAAETTQAA